MNALLLARWQFGITTVYHFLFVPLTIGLSILVAVMQTVWTRTGDPRYLRMTKFGGGLFLINFAMGVVTGIVQGVPVRDGPGRARRRRNSPPHRPGRRPPRRGGAMTAPAGVSRSGRVLPRMLRLAGPLRGQLGVAVLAGSGAAGCAIGLIAVSGWLLARAA